MIYAPPQLGLIGHLSPEASARFRQVSQSGQMPYTKSAGADGGIGVPDQHFIV